MARRCETCERPLSRFYVRHRNPRTGAKECDDCVTSTASIDGDFARFLDTVEDGLGDLWMAGSKEYDDRYDAQTLEVRQMIDAAEAEKDRMLYGGSLQTEAEDLGFRYDTYIVRGNVVIAGPVGADEDAVALAEHLGGQAVDYEVLGSMVGLSDPQGLIRSSGLQYEAHDAGDGETIYHCPFCGSGNVVARSDGSAECGHCHTVFTVQMQPQHPFTPQTIDGQPYDNPDMPGQVTDPTVEGTQPQQPPEGEAAPGQESLIFTPPGMGEPFDPAKAPQEQPAQVAASRWFVTASGDPLPENSYLRHLAIVYADDREKAIAQVRAEHAEG